MVVQNIITLEEQSNNYVQQQPLFHCTSFSPSNLWNYNESQNSSQEIKLSDSFDKKRIRKGSIDCELSLRSSRKLSSDKVPQIANRLSQKQQPFYPLNEIQSEFLMSQEEDESSSDNSETLFGTGINDLQNNDMELIIEVEDIDSSKFKQLCNEIKNLSIFKGNQCFNELQKCLQDQKDYIYLKEEFYKILETSNENLEEEM